MGGGACGVWCVSGVLVVVCVGGVEGGVLCVGGAEGGVGVVVWMLVVCCYTAS